MKPYIDMASTLTGEFISNSLFVNRMLNHWGTFMIDDVEVFNQKFYIYPREDSIRYRKILNMLNMADSVRKESFQGVESYYLWLNPKKASDSLYTDDLIAGQLNNFISMVDYTYVLLNLSDPADPAKFAGMTTEQLKTYVNTNYATLVDSLVVARGTTLVSEAIGSYVLLDNNQCLDVIITNIGTIAVPKTVDTEYGKVTTYTTNIAIEVKYRRKATFHQNSTLVLQIMNEAAQAKKRLIAELANADEDYDMNTVTSRKLLKSKYSGVTDDFWYKGHLRTSTIRSKLLTRSKFAKLVGNHFDTGYTVPKKKSKWWQKVLGPVLFIAAALLAPWTGGASLALYWAVVAVAFTVLALAMNAWGDTVTAKYMGRYATISGYVSAVTGVAAIFQNMVREIATQGLKEYVLSQISTVVTKITETFASAESGSLLTNVGNYIMDNFRAVLVKTVSVGNKVTSYWMEKRAERICKLMDANGAILDEQRDAMNKLTDKEYDIGLEDIKMYSKPLTVDNIQFEVDYLYEPSKFNICRPSFIVPDLNIRSSKVFK